MFFAISTAYLFHLKHNVAYSSVSIVSRDLDDAVVIPQVLRYQSVQVRVLGDPNRQTMVSSGRASGQP